MVTGMDRWAKATSRCIDNVIPCRKYASAWTFPPDEPAWPRVHRLWELQGWQIDPGRYFSTKVEATHRRNQKGQHNRHCRSKEDLSRRLFDNSGLELWHYIGARTHPPEPVNRFETPG